MSRKRAYKERCPVDIAILVEEGDTDPEEVIKWCKDHGATSQESGVIVHWVVFHNHPDLLMRMTAYELRTIMSTAVALN